MRLVYKYGTCGTLEAPGLVDRVLCHGRLTFTSVAALNDVFEALPNNGARMAENAEKELRRIVRRLRDDPASKYHGQSERYIRLVVSLQGHYTPSWLKRLSWIASAQLMSPFGVLSLSWSRTNLLLWSHYADGGKGLAIGFDPDNEVFANSSFQGTAGLVDVRYRPDRADLSEPDLAVRLRDLVFGKSMDWEYEQEVRCVREVALGQLRTVVDFDRKAVREIIIGPKMATFDAERIIEIKRILYPDAELKIANPNPADYAMDIDSAPNLNSFARFWQIDVQSKRRLGLPLDASDYPATLNVDLGAEPSATAMITSKQHAALKPGWKKWNQTLAVSVFANKRRTSRENQTLAELGEPFEGTERDATEDDEPK